ncbi:S26 family signal peptidase [Labrys neptuniae]|uniref:S26 family signal peptidase n=1 Tax=Labrys neptuniae TaxID=376174 RepID=UPI00288FA7DA|nr:S26 family signal peptidase [Labrys neptuniae]MDT3382419.1 S26 family signal peptidase [Labrys neptuniae]
MTRFGYVIAATLAVVGTAIPTIVPMPLRLVWNASASTPIGLYLVASGDALDADDLVVVLPPEPILHFMVERGYVGQGVPLLKHVAARSGQVVCRRERSIRVDGALIGDALDRDRQGRVLPIWQGCHRLSDGEIFVMNRNVRDSFDGRYFGVLPASSVIGRAIPSFTDEAGEGRFRWHAPTR